MENSGKGKILGFLLLILGLMCFAAYFLIGDKFGEVKVTFNSNGGSLVTAQTIKSGEKATEPTAPTKENSEFVEWQLNGVKYDFNSAVTKNILLVAKWNDEVSYEITVKLEDKDYTAKVLDGQTIKLEDFKFPEKEGKKVKLYTEDEKEYDMTSKVTAELKLTGKYVDVKTYTVTFNSNGGSKVDAMKVEEGEKIEEPKSTRDGYVLDGWYLNDQKFDFTTPITKSITLKAKWNDGTKVTVTFNVDEKAYKTVQVKENTTVSKPANPTKKGYKFVEWQLAGTAFDFKTKITEPIVLTAVFEEATSSKVTFNSDGGSTVKAQEVEYGKKATKPDNPTKAGYAFVEWQLNGKTYDFSKEVTDDITLKAVWIKEYQVEFDSNGGNAVASVTVKEGEKITAPSVKRDGWKLAEWLFNNRTYDFSDTVNDALFKKYNKEVSSQIKLTARWIELNKFTVKFDSDGGTPVPDSQTVREGDKANRPASDPTKEGYTFAEWQLNGVKYDFNSPVTGNITIKAKWDAINPVTPDVEEDK